MRPLAVARWILLVPVAVAAWCGVAMAGIPVHGYVEHAFCPANRYWDGLCYGPEAEAPLEILMNVFIGLSALVVVSVATMMAPSHRRQVAWGVFAIGSCVAIAIGIASRLDFDGEVVSHWDYVASAIGTGLLAVLVIDRWLRRIGKPA
jgi:hypothetical protein